MAKSNNATPVVDETPEVTPVVDETPEVTPEVGNDLGFEVESDKKTEMLNACFEAWPDVKGLYQTRDGMCFFEENTAVTHSKTIRSGVEYFEK